MKHDQYHNNATYNSQTAWNANDTNPTYKADNGLSCLVTTIIAISLIAGSLFYFGLF